MDGRSPSPMNSFKELYLSSTQAMIRRKEEMSLSITKYIISLLKAHCHPPINDHLHSRCLLHSPIGPPFPESRPPLLTQVSKTMNISSR
ncbi:hypothetical protein TNCV_1089761 [Trichonephila clavipes]|uniref:Uncharacterized protein n=1 Tax=Trichonephila clavipes TaxID=2585209 RepID=A0A8X6ST07_TRICX|nr:hypothetical protein TNCV_1089761 [Trichonephila clavipes]